MDPHCSKPCYSNVNCNSSHLSNTTTTLYMCSCNNKMNLIPPYCSFYHAMHFTCIKHTEPYICIQFSSVQSLSHVRLFATPWIAACQASLSITKSGSSLRFMSIESVMPSSHLFLCCPLLLLSQSLPASKSFPMSQLFAWGGQSTGVSALASFVPKNTQDWSPLEWTLRSPCSPRDSQGFDG